MGRPTSGSPSRRPYRPSSASCRSPRREPLAWAVARAAAPRPTNSLRALVPPVSQRPPRGERARVAVLVELAFAVAETVQCKDVVARPGHDTDVGDGHLRRGAPVAESRAPLDLDGDVAAVGAKQPVDRRLRPGP